jgi:hypothetical protein
MAEPLPEKCKIIANRNWFQFNTETSRNRESAGHLGLPFFQKVAEEQENGKEQTKKGPLSRSDFQVKKGHCKKAYPNICIIGPRPSADVPIWDGKNMTCVQQFHITTATRDFFRGFVFEKWTKNLFCSLNF